MELWELIVSIVSAIVSVIGAGASIKYYKKTLSIKVGNDSPSVFNDGDNAKISNNYQKAGPNSVQINGSDDKVVKGN
ncbi:MAG: hypothetical protein PHG18_02365 [Bacilli bacterium]|nr:hypothetical protein [Bacilli bacterium]